MSVSKNNNKYNKKSNKGTNKGASKRTANNRTANNSKGNKFNNRNVSSKAIDDKSNAGNIDKKAIFKKVNKKKNNTDAKTSNDKSANIASINWFPGHMRKALNDIEENLKLVDIVYETCDARIPFSSRNPELDRIIGDKKRIIILNKADLADDKKTSEWISYFAQNNTKAIAMDSTKNGSTNVLVKATRDICSDILERAKAKGRIGRPLRVMVVGVPNTGKSTLINSLCGHKVAITGDKPGVTRQPKWLKAGDFLELMDMPGVLWPKIQTKKSQLCLTATGAIKNEITDQVEVAYETIKMLNELYPDLMCDRYGITLPESKDFDEDEYIYDDYDRFLFMAKKRGAIMSGGRIDEERFAKQVLDDLRSLRIGKITFEVPAKPKT